MKKLVLLSFWLALPVVFAATGCSGSKSENKEQKAAEQYQCPMKCTEEIFKEPGKCPVCGMDLEKITNS